MRYLTMLFITLGLLAPVPAQAQTWVEVFNPFQVLDLNLEMAQADWDTIRHDTRAWRCWGLCRVRQLLDLHIGIPSLEHSAQFAVEGLDTRLQQQMRTPFAPLHLLFFAEAFAHDLVHGRLDKPRGYRLAIPIPLAIIRDQVRIVHDIGAELFHGFE